MKRIAIVGSVSAKRHDYAVPVANLSEVRAAAQLLGAELAIQGFGIIVYSADPTFIERDVVSAYVSSGKARASSIHLVYPANNPQAAAFPEASTHASLFDPDPNSSPDWEATYYRSLKKADGVLLIGGGYSTLITGIIARTFLIPVVALSYFGGSAEKVWSSLIAGQDLPDENTIKLMGLAPAPTSASKLVASFNEQWAARRRLMQDRIGVAKVLGAIVALLAWLAALPIGYVLLENGAGGAGGQAKIAFLFLLFLAPLVAGLSGSTVRFMVPSADAPGPLNTLAGATAGATAGVLYIASQYVGGASLHNFAWLLFAELFGFVGGFTYDRLFAKLQTADVARTEVFTR